MFIQKGHSFMQNIKQCSKCLESKPSDEFYLESRIKSGLSSQCKECQAKKRERQRSTGYIRYYHLYRRYGITKEEYELMLSKQDSKCAICGSKDSKYFSRSKYLVVDHCHKTGKIRGLLCAPCNTLLGNIESLGVDVFSG